MLERVGMSVAMYAVVVATGLSSINTEIRHAPLFPLMDGYHRSASFLGDTMVGATSPGPGTK